MPEELQFVMMGAGFWARYQLAGWGEVPGAQCVGIYNRTLSKAEALACEFGIEHVAGDPAELLDRCRPDFVDIVTDASTHAAMVNLVAQRGLPAICQKPLATDPETARAMVAECRRAGTGLWVHENWRWQHPIRAFRKRLREVPIGQPWRARVMYNNSFPVFENQPFLKELDRFILMDIGTHVLDTTRFLFGEVESLYCRIHRVNPIIKGEDAASLSLSMQGGLHVNVEMSYASRVADERFPQTYLLVEGSEGSIELRKDFEIWTTTHNGIEITREPPPMYPWLDSDYAAVHASIVDCHRNLLDAVKGKTIGETTGVDNLRTLKLVFAAYESARTGHSIKFSDETS